MASSEFDRALDRLIQDANGAKREARDQNDVRRLSNAVNWLAEAVEEFATKLKEEERARSRAQRQT